MGAALAFAKMEGEAMIAVTTAGIRSHNQMAAAQWSACGTAYDQVSETTADAIEHLVVRLAPRPAERFLDVATGTGQAARRLSARGASVVGVDIAAGMIAAARKLAPATQFELGDAESLAFPDAAFDGVVSTFGVMFVAHAEDAARELARVCRRGGRLGLIAWVPGDTVACLAKVTHGYAPAESVPSASPFDWGRRERIKELLGDAFALKFEAGVTMLRRPSGKAVWELFVVADGPTKAVAARLDPDRRRQLAADFAAFHDAHRTELGVAVPREYLVTIGVRR
jgi:ubiquinone/menaquinone biosynthesis C-methylase UbiE